MGTKKALWQSVVFFVLFSRTELSYIYHREILSCSWQSQTPSCSFTLMDEYLWHPGELKGFRSCSWQLEDIHVFRLPCRIWWANWPSMFWSCSLAGLTSPSRVSLFFCPRVQEARWFTISQAFSKEAGMVFENHRLCWSVLNILPGCVYQCHHQSSYMLQKYRMRG